MDIKYPETIMNQSEGQNLSESLLNKLCKKTFLSLWSYANIYRDQGICKHNLGKATGKEICDLLIVIGHNVIIFSDKHCEMKTNGDILVNWRRWYKKAVKESANQIFGAERWIFDYKDRIFIDQECKHPFPYAIPEKTEARIFRIVVAHGASTACKEVLGGCGSLMIQPNITGDMHPFTIGQIEPEKGFIHVFDDKTLHIILETLDTAPDFIDYLEKKEELYYKNILVSSTGEEELLAQYLSNTNLDGEHTFFPPNYSPNVGICIFEGLWNQFKNSEERFAQIEANKVSYAWDDIIEKFVMHITSGTSYYLSHPDIASQEEMLRFLVMENRLHRRLLSQILFGLLESTSENKRATRTILPQESEKPLYLFFALPNIHFVTDIDYRASRGALLSDYLKIVKLHHPNVNHLVGIATESGLGDDRSEDIIYLDARDWTEQNNINANEIELELKRNNLLANKIIHRTTTFEYPIEIEHIDIKGVKGYERNHPCPCGSGRKFKKCCGNDNI